MRNMVQQIVTLSEIFHGSSTFTKFPLLSRHINKRTADSDLGVTKTFKTEIRENLVSGLDICYIQLRNQSILVQL